MSKRFEWSLIPYPYFRAFTLFNAFILSAITIGIITGLAIEIRDVITEYLEINSYYQGYNEDITRGEKNKHLYNPGEHIKLTTSSFFEKHGYHNLIPRALRSIVISTILCFSVYLMMYFIFGYGGSLTTPRRKWRLFSSITGNKKGKIFV